MSLHEQTGDADCDWRAVLVWDPPRRLVFAWKIDAQWQYEPDLAKSSEVEIRFTPEAGGRTVSIESTVSSTASDPRALECAP